jgi:hypothetical protein
MKNIKDFMGFVNEGFQASNFKVGQKFKEVTNRGYIVGQGYNTASSGGGAKNFNDFSFNDPKVLKVSNDGIVLRLDYGDYNPYNEWKRNQIYKHLGHFCLVIPFQKIQQVEDNQLHVSIMNEGLDAYITESEQEAFKLLTSIGNKGGGPVKGGFGPVKH